MKKDSEFVPKGCKSISINYHYHSYQINKESIHYCLVIHTNICYLLEYYNTDDGGIYV